MGKIQKGTERGISGEIVKCLRCGHFEMGRPIFVHQRLQMCHIYPPVSGQNNPLHPLCSHRICLYLKGSTCDTVLLFIHGSPPPSNT